MNNDHQTVCYETFPTPQQLNNKYVALIAITQVDYHQSDNFRKPTWGH